MRTLALNIGYQIPWTLNQHNTHTQNIKTRTICINKANNNFEVKRTFYNLLYYYIQLMYFLKKSNSHCFNSWATDIKSYTCCNPCTESERITSVTWITCTAGLMAGCPAGGMLTTNTWTRVNTLVIDTSLVVRALGVDWTFWLTFNVGISKHFWETCAWCCSVALPTHSIDATRGWLAGINNFGCWRCAHRFPAFWEWISEITLEADAQWQVIADLASGIDAAQTGTRILALAVDTSLVGRAVWVDHAFGTAVGRRADHFWLAGAAATVADDLGRVGIGPAGVGVAGIFSYDWFYSWNKVK